MFSVNQKRIIANQVQKILRETNHPELPTGEITFHLHVDGAKSWSWTDIKNNAAIDTPDVNPWNEKQDPPCDHGNATSMPVSHCEMTPECAKGINHESGRNS